MRAPRRYARPASVRLALMLRLACPGAASGAEAEKGVAVPEVPLWPEGSIVLQRGMEALATEAGAHTHPSYRLYPAPHNPSGAAVLVFPGGGYKRLAIDADSTIGPEGAAVCAWLNEAGLSCVLVKYRVPNTGCSYNPLTHRHETPAVPMALQDAQRALSLVRARAAEYGLDPHKIGVLGFSAGGHLAAHLSTAPARAYAPIDAADHVSSRPDFAIPVYPGHMTMEHKNQRTAAAAQALNTDLIITADVPPTLLIHAKDDPIDPLRYSEVYARALTAAGAPVQLNVYETGGHAFGVAVQGKATDRWRGDALAWLREIGVLNANEAGATEGAGAAAR